MTTTPPYIAIASDMDGTLLRNDHTASAETAAVLNYVTRQLHVPFVFATGRHHVDVLATKRRLGLSGYVITSNGARVHDDADKVIIKNDLPAGVAKRLALLAVNDPDIVTSIYQEDHWYISREARDLTDYYQDNKDVFFYRLFDPTTHASYDGTYKVYYTSDKAEKLQLLEAKLAKTFIPGEIYTTYSVPFCLEVMEGNINKGVALGQLLDEYLFPRSDKTGTLSVADRRKALLHRTIAFGDGENDFELLSAVGKACVMANAQNVLRVKIDAHTGASAANAARVEYIKSNMVSGVAEKLREEFNISEADLAAFAQNK